MKPPRRCNLLQWALALVTVGRPEPPQAKPMEEAGFWSRGARAASAPGISCHMPTLLSMAPKRRWGGVVAPFCARIVGPDTCCALPCEKGWRKFPGGVLLPVERQLLESSAAGEKACLSEEVLHERGELRWESAQPRSPIVAVFVDVQREASMVDACPLAQALPKRNH